MHKNEIRVLVVDRNAKNLAFLAGILTDLGYSVQSMQPDEMLLPAITTYDPDLILLAAKMQDQAQEIDAYALCEKILANVTKVGIQVIFFGDFQDVAEREKVYKSGAVDYLSEPFQSQEVMARVNTHLALLQLKRQTVAQNIENATSLTLSADLNTAENLPVSDRSSNQPHSDRDQTFRTLAENSPYITCRYDRNLRFVYVTPKIENLVAIAHQDFIGKTHQDLGYPAYYANLWDDALKQVFDTGKEEEIEFDFPSAIGLRNYRSNFLPEFAEDGAVEFVLVINHDLTELKQTEQTLNYAYQKLNFHVNNSPLAVIEWNNDFTIKHWSQRAEEIFGWKAEEVVNRSWQDFRFAHEDDIATVAQAVSDLVSGKENYSIVFNRSYTKDGSTIHSQWHNSAFRDQDGNLVSMMSQILDVNDRRLAEEALKESEIRFRSIVENANDILFTLTPQGTFGYASLNFTKILGYALDAVIDQPFAPFIHPDDLYICWDAFNRLVAGEPAIAGVEYRAKHLDGGYRWQTSNLARIQDENNQFLYCIGIARDNTQRKEADEKLYQSEKRYKLATQAAKVGVWEWDISANQLYIDSKIKSLLGYGEEEESSNYLSLWTPSYIHPDDRNIAKTAMRSYLNGDIDEYACEYRMVHRDGSLRWIFSRGEGIRDEHGEFVRVIGTHTDISDRKQIELALQKQLQRSLLLSQITDEIRQSLDADQMFDIAATKIGQTFSVSRCVIHRYVTEPEPQMPFVCEYLASGYNSVIHLKVPFEGNFHVQKVLSQDRPIAANNVFTDPLLQLASSVCEMVDMKSMLAVRTSYHGKPNGLIGLQQCDRFREWTDDEIDLLEAIAAQVGIAIAQVTLLKQEIEQRRELALKNEALNQAMVAAEGANMAKSAFLATMSHEIRTPMNAVLGMTELLLRSNLSPKQQDLAATIQDSGGSLLTIINDILDFSKIESGNFDLEIQPLNLKTSIERVINLLSLKADEKDIIVRFDLDPQVPLHIVGDVIRLEQILTNLISNAIKFTESGEILIEVTATKLSKELLLNRELNYIGGLTESYYPLSSGHEIQFAIQDSGVGIAADQLNRLFKPFSQVDASITRRYGGTGLGLAICTQLVEMMGGRIWVVSNGCLEGEPPLMWKQEIWENPNIARTNLPGSRFYFTIYGAALSSEVVQSLTNLKQKHDSSPINPSPAMRVKDLEGSWQVLLAEDNTTNQKLATLMLEQLGYFPDIVGDGIAVVEALKSKTYNLILMDLQMPNMDGLTATRTIRSQGKNSSSPYIIAITANASRSDREKCLEAGMNDYVSKPIMIQELANALHRFQDAMASMSADTQDSDHKAAIDSVPQRTEAVEIRALESIRNMSNNVIVVEMIDVFLDDSQQLVTQISASTDLSNSLTLKSLSDAVHTLKSISASIGAVKLAELCKGVESSIKEAKPEDAIALTSTIAAEYQLVNQSLLGFRQKYSQS
jgi:PAS domain S-box-containing protein